MPDDKNKKDPPAPPVVAGKKNVAGLFKQSKTKPYLLQAFCVYTRLQPESEISEADFNRKLKEFLNLRLG